MTLKSKLNGSILYKKTINREGMERTTQKGSTNKPPERVLKLIKINRSISISHLYRQLSYEQPLAFHNSIAHASIWLKKEIG